MNENAPLSPRARYYRRAFSRGIKRNPDAFERALMRRAATLAAMADEALADPTVSLNDRVRICGAADRAYAAMAKALEKQRAKNAPNEFAAYVAEAGA